MRYRLCVLLFLVLTATTFAQPVATFVFAQEKTVFFSMDEIDSVATAGGCTQAWWDAAVAGDDAAHAMAHLVDAIGEPLIDTTLADFTGTDTRVTQAGIGTGVEVGMVGYAVRDGGAAGFEMGWYKVTDVDGGGGWIEIAGADAHPDCTVSVTIGGAFDTLQNAADNLDGTSFDVTVNIQSEDVLSAQIGYDAYGGSAANNSWFILRGFNTSPGDMDYGGAYYESPFEILDAGSIDATKTVKIDADGDSTDFEHINIDVDNVIFENIQFDNSTGKNAILFSNTPQNVVFRNCRFSDTNFVFATAATHVLVDSCYSHSDLTGNHYSMAGNDNIILNCVANVAATKIFAVVATVEGCKVVGCVVVNGARGIRVFGFGVVAVSNTFYDQTSFGVDITNGKTAFVHNNIFALNPGAVGLTISTAGSFVNDYNLYRESDDTALTVGSHTSGGQAPVAGPHSIEVDPLFIDAANNKFDLLHTSPVIGVGRRDVFGRATNIGAGGYMRPKPGPWINPWR